MKLGPRPLKCPHCGKWARSPEEVKKIHHRALIFSVKWAIIIIVLVFTSIIVIGFLLEEPTSPDQHQSYTAGSFVNATMETVDFSKEIGDDGSVSYDYPSYVGDITYYNWTKTYNLTIYNNNTGGVMIEIFFQHPNSSIRKQGLHDNLETETLSVYCYKYDFAFYGVEYSEKYTRGWWADTTGAYNRRGFYWGVLDENKSVSIPITFSLERSYPGTFQDGQTYQCTFWIVDRNMLMEVPFEVRT